MIRSCYNGGKVTGFILSLPVTFIVFQRHRPGLRVINILSQDEKEMWEEKRVFEPQFIPSTRKLKLHSFGAGQEMEAV